MDSDNESKWVICRICLKPGTEMTNIFEGTEKNLLAKIEECGGVELDTKLDLPDSICSKCLTLLKAATKFRSICQRTQAALKKQFGHESTESTNDKSEKSPTPNEEFPEEFLKFNQKDEDIEFVEANPTAVEVLQDTNFITDDCINEQYDLEYEQAQEISNEANDDSFSADGVGFELIKDEAKLGDYSEHEQEMVEYVLQIDGDQKEGNFKIIPQIKEKTLAVNPLAIKTNLTTTTLTAAAETTAAAAKQKRKYKSVQIYENAKGVFECPKCENVYANKNKLILHLKQHNQDKPHECEICYKRFAQTPQLARHMNTHTGQRPFQCTFCPASFADPSTRIKHIRTHTNERPYKCDVCSKSFTYSNVLKVHQMIHTGEKPFSCKFCNKKFSQAHHRKNHERTHTTYKKLEVFGE